MDSLDVIFDAMRVQSVLHARLEASAPWGLSFRRSARAKFGLIVRHEARTLVDQAQRKIRFTRARRPPEQDSFAPKRNRRAVDSDHAAL